MSVGRASPGGRRNAQKRRRSRPDIVVKLGGSLLSDRARLMRLVGAICDCPSKVLVVPGGGPFADAVRVAHAEHGFSEATAHDMAVLATEQTGLLIGDLDRAIVPVSNDDDLSAAFDDGQQAVALVGGFIAAADDLPRTWQATSDTIAAWLAVEYDVATLIYVKSCPVAKGASIEDLSARGVLDPVCGSLLTGSSVDVEVIGADDDERLTSLMGGDRGEGAEED